MSNGNSASKLVAEINGLMESFLVRRCSEIEKLFIEREYLKIRIQELERQKKEKQVELEALKEKATVWEKKLKELEGNLEVGFNEAPEENEANGAIPHDDEEEGKENADGGNMSTD